MQSLIFHDVQQNSEQWLLLRAQKPTSSKLAVIMAHYGKAFGEPAKKYAVDIAIEQITGVPVSGGYSNDHMERGHEEEPLARMLYEQETFSTVTNGGFFDHGFFGCSPDGLISTDGAIEVKAAIPSVHYDRVCSQSFDSAYKWQLIGNMKFTERDWIDFVSYCGSFPVGKKLYVHRLIKSDYAKEMQMIDERLEQFLALIATTKQSILDSEYFLTDTRRAA